MVILFTEKVAFGLTFLKANGKEIQRLLIADALCCRAKTNTTL